jgi:hypothetical protein
MEALDKFQHVMSGLRFHASLEEKNLFPALQATYPDIDLRFLYEEHAYLFEREQALIKKFDITEDLLCEIVKFDKLFNTHLGEEEDVVAPMCLLNIFDFDS